LKKNLRNVLKNYGSVIALIVVYVFFMLVAPDSFSSLRNLETIARQTAIVGTISLGMTLVIISGGVDLSVGSMLALSTVLIALGLNEGFSPIISVILSIVVLGFFGFLTGLIITKLRIMPFIVTLGSLLIMRGAAKGMAGEQKIDAPLTGLTELLATLPAESRWQLLAPGVWLTIILAVLTSIILNRTRFGRHVYAIGSNEKTAILCGVAVNKVKTIVYSLSACFAAVAGVLQFSRLTVGDPTVGAGLELEAIAAVVIGGGSLSGGEGSVFGSLVGALIMSVIRSGCSQIGMSNWIQEIVTGSIIILAVIIDRLRHN
jgi:ribose transport system permease protein